MAVGVTLAFGHSVSLSHFPSELQNKSCRHCAILSPQGLPHSPSVSGVGDGDGVGEFDGSGKPIHVASSVGIHAGIPQSSLQVNF